MPPPAISVEVGTSRWKALLDHVNQHQPGALAAWLMTEGATLRIVHDGFSQKMARVQRAAMLVPPHMRDNAQRHLAARTTIGVWYVSVVHPQKGNLFGGELQEATGALADMLANQRLYNENGRIEWVGESDAPRVLMLCALWDEGT